MIKIIVQRFLCSHALVFPCVVNPSHFFYSGTFVTPQNLNLVLYLKFKKIQCKNTFP